MKIEPTSFKPVFTPDIPISTPQHPVHQLRHSSLQSLSIHQKEPSTFFNCIKRFFEILCLPFMWLYNLFFPTKETPEPQKIEIGPKEQVLEANPNFPNCIVKDEILPFAYPLHIQHPNKLAAYKFLMDRHERGDPIPFYKYAQQDRSYLSACPLFDMSAEKGGVYCEDGLMPYGNSTEECIHWVASFADPHVMGFCEGPLLTQDEEHVVWHPHLYHVKTALKEKGHARMLENEVYLLKNVPCKGKLPTLTPVAEGRPWLYGNAFAKATEDEVIDKLEARFPPMIYNIPPRLSNIFYIAAPRIGDNLTGKPYQKAHLEQLFYTAYTAFYGVKEQSNDYANCAVHTGNWGVEAFGNSAMVVHLIQLAAARAAGVTVYFHPLDKKDEFYAAQALFHELENQYPDMGIDQFLEHLAQNASEYQLFYGIGNGT